MRSNSADSLSSFYQLINTQRTSAELSRSHFQWEETSCGNCNCYILHNVRSKLHSRRIRCLYSSRTSDPPCRIIISTPYKTTRLSSWEFHCCTTERSSRCYTRSKLFPVPPRRLYSPWFLFALDASSSVGVASGRPPPPPPPPPLHRRSVKLPATRARETALDSLGDRSVRCHRGPHGLRKTRRN